ncbi:HAMP domain-containing protein, partial [Paracoccus sp. (in: a-proteobacteria)]|uniref:PDC sensor domain-containing protein n=1 Tax=Paracoccus sp. TaxID=267 RepID=UPI00396C4217
MQIGSMSIRTKVAVASAALTSCAVIAVIALTINLMSRASTQEAEARARALMGEFNATVTQELSSVLEVVNTSVAAVESAIRAQSNRDVLGQMIEGILQTRPDLVGATLAFEPNALGDDRLNVGARYSDAAGRFLPYFYHGQEGRVEVELLDMSPEAGIETWYSRPLRENRSLVTSPYSYTVGEKDVLMTTISGVVRKDRKAVGILTGDLALDRLSTRIGEMRPFGEGRIFLVSNDGRWIAHEDPARLGQPVTDAEKILIPGDKALHHVTLSGEKTMLLNDSVRFAGMDEVWTLVMTVPTATVMANVVSTRNLTVLAAAALLAATLVLVWLGAQAISRPIEAMTMAMRRLAEGKMDTAIPHTGRGDEIGAMASAVEVFRDNAVDARR